jgi:hypothetical protein
MRTGYISIYFSLAYRLSTWLIHPTSGLRINRVFQEYPRRWDRGKDTGE